MEKIETVSRPLPHKGGDTNHVQSTCSVRCGFTRQLRGSGPSDGLLPDLDLRAGRASGAERGRRSDSAELAARGPDGASNDVGWDGVPGHADRARLRDADRGVD